MSVSSARVGTPCAAPSATMALARSRDCASESVNAPEPTFTSSTSAPAPSASFLLITELAISGSDSTVAVMSRTRRLDSAAVNPAMDSSLSSVPPVWPSPRPDACGTAAPHAATTGTRGRVILSPTPPVECLSTVGTPRSLKSSRSPEASIADVHRAVSPRSMPRNRIAISRAAICSSATRPAV